MAGAEVAAVVAEEIATLDLVMFVTNVVAAEEAEAVAVEVAAGASEEVAMAVVEASGTVVDMEEATTVEVVVAAAAILEAEPGKISTCTALSLNVCVITVAFTS